MRVRRLGIALLSAAASPAAAQLDDAVREACEARQGNLRLPTSPSGRPVFRKCDDCACRARFAIPATRWELNGVAVSLQELERGLQGVTNRNTTDVTVAQQLVSERITEVAARVFE